MGAEPEPSGRRRLPPTDLRTALVTGDGPRRVGMLLSVPAEAHCLAVAFRKLDFVAEIALDLDELLSWVLDGKTTIAIGDSLNTIIKLHVYEPWSATVERPLMILVSDQDTALPWVDFVIVRPFNRDDPLGIGQA